MPIETIHSYLAHPAKNEATQPQIRGTAIPKSGRLFAMLSEVYHKAQTECDIEVIFRHQPDGRRQNEFRDHLVRYLRSASLVNGRRIAERLQSVTTNRSGLGLLFLMKGSEKRRSQIVISRFPADQGILAQEGSRGLDVRFIERVFMKSATAYKSALYAGVSLDTDFWEGRAVDRQLNGPRELSDYWINDFLMSDLATTGPAGTKRLAIALREAVKAEDDPHVRQELMSIVPVVRGQGGRRNSAARIVERLGLSLEAMEALREAFPRPELFEEIFQFDVDEYDREIAYRAVELDSGGMLIGPARNFDSIFRHVQLEESRVRYIAEGKVVDERVRKNR